MAVTYNDYIYYCYSDRTSRAEFVRVHNSQDDYFSNQAFSRFISVDISKDKFEIPCIYRRVICKAIADSYNSADESYKVDSVIIPMIIGGTDLSEAKTTNPLLRIFFRDCHYMSGTMLYMKKASGTNYIGGEGIIMYEDFTPMILFTLEVQKIQDSESNIMYKPLRPILRINPLIFSNNDIVAKHIRNNMIGKIFEMKNSSGSRSRYSCPLANPFRVFSDTFLDWDFKVIVDDFSEFFIVPSIPDCTFSSDKVNNLLNENSAQIIARI